MGLAVAPLRVLSRLRRPLAQKWENDHDAAYFWGCCQGKACDRVAWAHSIMVAATKERQRKEAHETGFPRRLLASWCASCEGWRFLEADKCATFPFRAFGPSAAKLMLATLLETMSSRLPTYMLWNVVDDISWVPQDGSGPHCRSSQALGGGPSGVAFSVLQGQVRGSH